MTVDLVKREHDIARADAAALALWKETVLRAAEYVARKHRTFTSDDIWDAMRDHYPQIDTPEHRAMGAVMRRVVSEGWGRLAGCTTCGTTKVMRQSTRAVANGSDTPVYQSLIFGRPAP